MPRPALLLTALFLFAAHAAPAQTPVARIDTLLASYHDYGLFNGNVLVADGGEIVYEKSFGPANRSWDVPHAADTRFRIGSITKQFTAALVLQLVEEGAVELDAPITRYLPDYPAMQGDSVTVHHLLTHTSGIPSYTSLPNFLELTRDPYAPDSFLTVFSGLDLEFEPGTQYRYSNSGYFILGVLVEHVTGLPYADALRRRLLDPLGLDDTGYETNAAIVKKMARGYFKTVGGYERAPYLDTSVPYAAGMLYATARDLYDWNRALHSGQVFEDAETLERMTTPFLDGYAYGLTVSDQPLGEDSVRTIAHGGGIFGFTAMLRYMPDEGRTVVVLDNTAQDAPAVADALTRLLYGQPVERPRQPIADVLYEIVEAEGLEAAVARYRTLKEETPETYDLGESQLNTLGYAYLNRGEVETAIRIFQLNVEAFPEAWNPYDSLGEAYLEAGNRERAAANYRKALALNPGSQSARAALERLGVESEPATVDVSADVLDRYVGRYQVEPGFVITVTREGTHLYAQPTGQPRFKLHPSSTTRFYLTEADVQLTFETGDEERPGRLILIQNGAPRPAERIE